MMSDKLDLWAIRSGGGGGIHMTKVTLGLQNHWRMANGGVGIVSRDLTLAEIRSNPLLAEGGVGIINRGAIQRGSTVFKIS